MGFIDRIKNVFGNDNEKQSKVIIEKYGYITNNEGYVLPYEVYGFSEELEKLPSRVIGKTKYFNGNAMTLEQKFDLLSTITLQLDFIIRSMMSIDEGKNKKNIEIYQELLNKMRSSENIYNFFKKTNDVEKMTNAVKNYENVFINVIKFKNNLERTEKEGER